MWTHYFFKDRNFLFCASDEVATAMDTEPNDQDFVEFRNSAAEVWSEKQLSARQHGAVPEWTMSQEREFMENLVNQRFYYFCVIYTVIVGGAFAAKSDDKAKAILFFGAILLGFMLWSIRHANNKLKHILSVLHRIEDHPVRFIGLMAKATNPGVPLAKQVHPSPKEINPLDAVWIVATVAVISVIYFLADMCGYVLPAFRFQK